MSRRLLFHKQGNSNLPPSHGVKLDAKWSNAKLLYGGAVANGILYFNTASQQAPSAPTADGYDYDSTYFGQGGKDGRRTDLIDF